MPARLGDRILAERESLFRDYIRRQGGDPDTAVATLRAQYWAEFNQFYPAPTEPPGGLPDFSDPVWAEPLAVYRIYCKPTDRAYVGTAQNGFLSRYPGGRWWENHHNPHLIGDVLLYGVTAFRVTLFLAHSEPAMLQTEAELLFRLGQAAYNIRLEPHAVSAEP